MRPRHILGVMCVAFLVRAAYVIVQDRFRIFDFSFVGGDALLYLDIAESIAGGHGMSLAGHPTAYVGPGYPGFLAMLRALGFDTLAIGLTQAVLGALTAGLAALLTFELARAMGMRARSRSVVAAVSGMGIGLYPHLVFWTGYVLTETLFVFFVSLSVYSVVRGGATANPGWFLVGGIVSGLASLTRAPYLAVALVVLAWALAAARGGSLRGIAPLVFALGLAWPLSIWTVRNVVTLGVPVITSTESGFVFYQGNSKGATGGTDGYVRRTDYRPLVLPPGLNEVEADSAYFRRALQDIAEDPLSTIGRWPRKVANMWRLTYADASLRKLDLRLPVSPLLGLVTLVSYAAALVLGTVGALLLARAGTLRVTVLPALILITWFVIHVVVTGMIRFRVPAELVLIAAAPFAVGALADRAEAARAAG